MCGIKLAVDEDNVPSVYFWDEVLSGIFLRFALVSPYFYYVKKPAGGEKAKVKLKAKKYNPATRKHEIFVEKKLPPHSK